MTINIPLLRGWRIISDKHNYILIFEKEDRRKIEGYFGDIESCINYFLSVKIRGFNSKDIQSLLNSIKRLQASLNKTLQPLNLRVERGDRRIIT